MIKREEEEKDYLTKWIEAEYEVAGWWSKKEDVATKPLIEEGICLE